MKRIKTVNGYAIYQAMTQRDADNYNCEVGSFNLYLASDIRDYGLSNSYPEYENIDALASALELANGSNYAIAEALADELSDSTIQDMDLIMEIERRLDNGETVEQITEAYDTEEQCFIENDVGAEEKEERAMKRFSEKELWAFVNRADTHERIQIASDFLTKLDYLDIDVYDDMMNALAYKSRELYHQDEDMDDYDEYLDSYMQTEDEDERRIFRCRQYNL